MSLNGIAQNCLFFMMNDGCVRLRPALAVFVIKPLCSHRVEGVRAQLKPFYSITGQSSLDPELMMRMLTIGYCMGIRSEHLLCEGVHLNLAYRWFCRLGLDGKVPDHSSFSKNRHGRFRQSDILRHLLETVVERCLAERLVGG